MSKFSKIQVSFCFFFQTKVILLSFLSFASPYKYFYLNISEISFQQNLQSKDRSKNQDPRSNQTTPLQNTLIFTVVQNNSISISFSTSL